MHGGCDGFGGGLCAALGGHLGNQVAEQIGG
jgi:hypothetical protein